MKKKLNIIFFIDYDENTGLGHLNRCLHLLKYFQKCNITFVTKKKLNIKGIININNFSLSIFNKNKFYNVAIIDSYKTSSALEKKIQKISKITITIDDLINRKFYSDFVINYNPNVKEINYRGKLSSRTKLLLGPNYNFILSNKKKIKTKNKKKNILIYFGTKDRTKLIKNIILKLKKNTKHIDKIIVLTKYKFQMKDFDIQFYFSLDRRVILNKIINADVCIISSGIIIYETLSFGKLIYSKPISKNQRPHFNYLFKNNKIFKIADLKKLDLSKKIISPDQNIYFSNSKILKIIFFPIKNNFGQSIYLDFFNLSFSKNIYSLQNKFYRKYYRNKETFSYKVHKKYIEEILKNPKIQLLVIKNKKNFVGYIKIEIKNKKSLVSIAIKKEFQGKNIASMMLKYLVKSNYFIYSPFAEINENNKSSLFAFKKAGFSINKNIKTFR